MKALFVGATPGTGSASYGTERVAAGLAGRLVCAGVDVHVAGHAEPGQPAGDIQYQDIQAHVLPPMPTPTREEHFDVRTAFAPGFAELLREHRPDIVHLSGIAAQSANRRHIELAKEAGAKVVLWHNVPGITCLRKTLLYEGTVPCDGEVKVQRCTYCRLRHVGVPRPMAAVASRIGVGDLSRGLPRRAGAVLGARQLTARFQRGVEAAFAQVDAIRVGAQWAFDVLRRNGVPGHKLHLIRPGVDLRVSERGARAGALNIWQHEGRDRPPRLLYWGRIYRAKGVHTLVEALALCPELSLELAIVGGAGSSDGYLERLQDQAAADKRIRFVGEIPPSQILDVVRTADLAMIPSLWLETGPLTVFEARAAGVPILGADRGGIAELCVEGQGTRLFPADNAAALSALLREVLQAPDTLAGLRSTIPQPRTIEHVAAEVHRLYTELLGTIDLPARGAERLAQTACDERLQGK